jgi:hypothetical protein
MLLTGLNTTKAADHADGPAANADPTVDIADLYAWMDNAAEKVNLVMTVPGTALSDGAQYVFHVNSSAGYLMPQTETLVIVQPAADGSVEVWVGDDVYVQGDASTRLDNADGTVSVFAGLRDDPFFFNISGFVAAVGIVRAAGALPVDADGCPQIDSGTAGLLVNQLQTEPDGSPAVDDFAGQSVTALVVQVDKSLVNSGGDTLGVWASTHTRQ